MSSNNQFNVWTQDCMSRIFPHQKGEKNAKKVSLQVAGNEVECFQIGVHGISEQLNNLHAEASNLVSAQGETIPKENVDILYAEYVPVHWHSAGNPPEDLEGQAPGFYPDPLLPSLWRGVGRVSFPDTVSIWTRIRVGESVPAGKYQGRVKVYCQAGEESVDVQVEVLPFSLPKRSHFLMTNWFLTGQILQFHKLEPLTDEFWKVIEIYAKNLSEHRQNVILTPLFTISGTLNLLNGRLQGQLTDIVEDAPGKYSFDFHNFDKWVEIFFQHGFELIEGGHLAGGSRNPAGILLRKPGESQAERRGFPSTLDEDYRNFLKQFLTALREHLASRNWLDKFNLHLSDEPHGEQFEAYTSLAKFVKSVVPEFKLMDAMGAAEYAPYVDHPVPLESQYERFVQTSGLPKEQIWFYYCCGPTGAWPNRFIDYPLTRVRIFTWLAFKHSIKGFLHWGLNHWGWHRPHYRAETYNPYDNTTGGSLQAGDSYVLYPPRMPSESHEPVDSIRWEIIRKAMEDYEYLHLLRELLTSGKGSKSDREQGRALMKELEEKVIPTFTEHTRDAGYLEDFRRRMGQTIGRLMEL